MVVVVTGPDYRFPYLKQGGEIWEQPTLTAEFDRYGSKIAKEYLPVSRTSRVILRGFGLGFRGILKRRERGELPRGRRERLLLAKERIRFSRAGLFYVSCFTFKKLRRGGLAATTPL